MAEMEKVTYAPLIALLQENAETLNQTLRSARAVSHQIDTADVPVWFAGVIEPVFTAIHQHDQKHSQKLFDILFRDMLSVLASPAAKADFAMNKDSRLLTALNPALTATNPTRVLKALTSAWPRISRYSPEAAKKWISMMQQIMPMIKDLKELLAAGRLAAWRCGMAHLRERVDVSAISDQRIMELIFSDEKDLTSNLKRRWNPGKITSAIAAGGFTGMGGTFSRPPLVALHGDLILVSDERYTRVLFADRFGHTLHDCSPDLVNSSAYNLKPVKSATKNAAEILGRYPDITSWVFHDATLFITTRSSHTVFIFGEIDG